jgi:hypothetical protein
MTIIESEQQSTKVSKLPNDDAPENRISPERRRGRIFIPKKSELMVNIIRTAQK